MQQIHPNIRKVVFWDVNFREIDWNKHEAFIITRVFERGTMEELKELYDFYGAEKIKKALLNAKYLPKRILNFAAIILNTEKSCFKCYSKTP